MTQRVWEARTGTQPADQMLAYSESTATDEQLVHVDLAGSIAHAIGLHEAGILDEAEAKKLVAGLQSLASEAQAGELELDPELEDVHMNVEEKLADEIGELADKLHTGRSRNDQVALDLTLATRQGLAQIGAHLHALVEALVDTASEHAETPWPMQTHGVPAQPATLGFLLHGHALRLSDDLDGLIEQIGDLSTSPLGSGAGAGSTLDLDPSTTAGLLGLDVPDNALVTAGARDGSLATVHLLAQVGHHVQSLAVDLLQLADEDHVELPGAYTTGSSIMPHKVNPDALELARADGVQLVALVQQLHAIVDGHGLGYARDFQRAKQPTLDALSLAGDVTAVLADVVDGLTVNEASLAQAVDDPQLATTDAAEALVEHGVAFRQAHQILAQVAHEADDDTTIANALEHAEIDPDALEAAKAALEPDPSARDTPGGPAPDEVYAQLDDLEATLDDQATALASIQREVQQPFTLLEAPPGKLVAQIQEGSP